jgi:hypothetical protein
VNLFNKIISMETTTNPALNNFKLQNRSLTVNDLKAQREAELREQSKAKLEDQRKKFNEIAEEKAKGKPIIN